MKGPLMNTLALDPSLRSNALALHFATLEAQRTARECFGRVKRVRRLASAVPQPAPATTINATAPAAVMAGIDSLALHRLARAQRAQAIGSTLRALFAGRRAAFAAWLRERQRRRLEQQTLHALDALDNRTLQDLGIARSEIGSVASELMQRVQTTRRLSGFSW